MAEILIHNMRNPDQIVSASITLRRAVIAGEAENPDMRQEGNMMWILEVSTITLDAEGNLIPPLRKWLSTQDTLSSDIDEMITQLSNLIPWDNPPDTEAPIVVSCWPVPSATQVSVDTSITVNIIDNIPSAGINPDSIRIKVKGFELTNQMQVNRDITSCRITVTPGTRYKSAI
jgi:hypothetical protein